MPPSATSRTSYIRNFSIIAHIDHGKSTLSDRILLKTGAIAERDFRNQVLDAMDLERERGITIRMHPVTCYHESGGQKYELNLIDTPGHVDFSYEVSRSLAACEGVILLVDAFQGVQAQTVANAFLAMESDLKIVPVLNKVDLPIARPDVVIAEMQQALGIEPADVLRASGKTGLGIDEVLQAIVDRVPAPAGDPDAPLQALVYNSHFDTYKGVVVYIRVMQGTLVNGQRIKLMRGGTEHEVMELGQFRPGQTICDRLSAGQLYLKLSGEADGDGASAKALELEAYNRQTGEKPINVAFLSGSQKFRVAVSLALGIGQYASRQHRPIESVIIDEGFGCLDRYGRQVMIQELQNLRSQMRCILLVSHQEEFADAFSDGYHFELEEGATRVKRFQR